MWHKVDYDKLVLLLLPTFMRQSKLFGYLKALVSPIASLHYQWSRLRDDNLKKLSYNSQKCYLRGALNDRYDTNLRRISIETTGNKAQDYIYTPAENLPVFLGTMWIEPEFNYVGTTVDFLVYVPADVMNTKLNEIMATLEFYVLAGKKYQIIST
ncbi:hypothetical protein [Flavobacterium sp. UMI-01]|uniref:hypothetical protein n=1 Tax=Flavobacterium sp. UMI-01 TaxID=1441053 RepID=UPI001C7D54D5|nr:hypothetical protein [Flavobacterium sp. UMI-01]GIZ10293.1 hypothetical protein FUMI01_30170 [Flavobacterium sp. UMI-01]